MTIKVLAIDLERPDGVYFAGEILTGVVRVETRGETLGCGVLLDFAAKSRSTFRRKCGELYLGETYYQEVRQTLAGNFFQSATVYAKGGKATFLDDTSSGLMSVDFVSATNDLKLAIKVTAAAERAEQPEVYGEIALPAAPLLRSTNVETFVLSVDGVLCDKLKITMSANLAMNDRGGRLVLLHVHEVEGLPNDGTCRPVRVQAYQVGPETNSSKSLPDPTPIELEEGSYTLPFSIAVREDLPGSAEFPHAGDGAFLRYLLTATVMDTPRHEAGSYERILTVLPHRPQPIQRLLSPIQRTEEATFARCTRGARIVVDWKLERIAYAPGEPILLAATTLNNQSPFMVDLSLVLKQHIMLRSFSGEEYYAVKEFSIEASSIAPRAQGNFKSIFNINMVHIPAVYPSFGGGVSEPSTRDDDAALSWTYSIELRASCKRMTHVFSLPVLVCPTPPTAPEATEERQISCRTFSRDPWTVFQFVGDGCRDTFSHGGDIVSAMSPIDLSYRNVDSEDGIHGDESYQPLVRMFTDNSSQ